MKKLIRPQDRILLFLSAVGDILAFFHEEIGIGKMSLKDLYGWTPSNYKRGNFIRTIKRLLKTGYIEKIIKNGKPYLRLTGTGKNALVRDYPLFVLQKKRWDKKWRIVIFDIEEENKPKRNFFQRKLKSLGLGMMQKSVYITPFDITVDLQEFIEEINLGGKVFVMEVNKIALGDAKTLARQVWPLEEINKNYQEILAEIKKTGKNLRFSNGNNHQRKLKELKEKYLHVLISDPCLPQELLPENWAGNEVFNSLNKNKEIYAGAIINI